MMLSFVLSLADERETKYTGRSPRHSIDRPPAFADVRSMHDMAATVCKCDLYGKAANKLEIRNNPKQYGRMGEYHHSRLKRPNDVTEYVTLANVDLNLASGHQ